MLILALEAVLGGCSAALVRDGAVLACRATVAERGTPAALPPMAEAVLRQAGVAAGALDAVAAAVGPGSFSGIRTALALAEGIALGANCPLVGVTTGEALAAALPAGEPRAVWAAIDNRRGRVVLERFGPGTGAGAGHGADHGTHPGAHPGADPEAHPRAHPGVEPAAVFEERALPWPAGPVLVVGDAAATVAARLAARGADVRLGDLRRPDAVGVAWVAARRLAGALPPLAAVPLYVEPPALRAPPPRSA